MATISLTSVHLLATVTLGSYTQVNISTYHSYLR